MTCLLVACLIGVGAFSQPSPTKQFLPNLTPVSPEATSLGKFGNYEVNLFTGLPDISIPIFDIKVGDLNVPISLNYHASGIKVDEMPSWVGLGWSLQTGGAITRKVMGMEDEGPGFYLSGNSTSANRVRLTSEVNVNSSDGLTYLSNVYLKYYDVQPDIFTYNFPGHNGNFLFNQRNGFQPVLIPYAPVQINKTYTTSNLDFNIVDEKGIEYQFGAKERTNFQYPSGQDIYIPSAWMLTKMTSANKQDAIDFIFNAPQDFRDVNKTFSHYAIVSDQVVNYVGNTYSSEAGTPYYDVKNSFSLQQIISEIRFKNGKIVFEAASEAREDLGVSPVFNLQKRLKYIKIYSLDAGRGQYNLIKTVELIHSYFMFNSNVATKRLRLDAVQVKGTGSTPVQVYGFNYNNSINMPDHFSCSKDYWGYFNNEINTLSNGTSTTVPKQQVPYGGATTWIGGSNINARNPNPLYNQACILQKITYPTGGYTMFEYETNQYLESPNPVAYAGGLRIKSIKSYTDATATPIVKTYKYGAGETGYGRKNFFPDRSFFSTGNEYRFYIAPGFPGNSGVTSLLAATKRQSVYFANPTVEMEPFDGAPVVYPEVTEYVGDGTTNTGKTIYQFYDKPDAKTTASLSPTSPVFDTYHYIRGLLTNKSVYRKNSNNTYTKIAETINAYKQFPFESTTEPVGFVLRKNIIFQNNYGEVVGTQPNLTDYVETNSYQFATYTIISSDNKLTSNTEIQYDQKNTSTYNSVVTNYTYDDKTHLQLSQTTTTNSAGETITSAYTHPYNYTTAPYVAMTTNHIYDPVVQETLTNSVGGQLSQKTTNFASFAGSNYLPGNVQLKIKANAVETRASFNQYDIRGNVLEVQKTGDIKQSYIWDYGTMHPVAEVTNAGQSDIAYTSFESDGKGGWAFTLLPSSPDPTAPTGSRYYTLGASITKTGLNATGTYIVSYWKKSGTVAVNATSPTTGRTVSGWTYYEHKVVNPAGGTITVSGTNGVIDELRLYPATALMKTYTYKPLIGISSICDANNRISYYEYDNFNRLMLIRDQDRNIIKQFCYNYAGQVENCNVYYNAVRSGNFTRNNCTGCLAGASVTYTVPAQTYSAASQAEADQMAQDDVNANGQVYANNFGTCTTPPNAASTGSNAVSGKSFTITLQNTCTGTNYQFTMPAGIVSGVALGSVPAGTYNVTFSTQAGSTQYTYRINGTNSIRGNGGTISNVTLLSSGNTIAITP